VISEDVIKQLADNAGSYRRRAGFHRTHIAEEGDKPGGIYSRLLESAEALATEYDQIANICHLLNSDGYLRDALDEAQFRAAAANPDGGQLEMTPAEVAAELAMDRIGAEGGQTVTATLVVSRSYSACAACGSQVLPGAITHDRISGYGGGDPGCGATFTAITSDYSMDAYTRATLADMRPDLPIVEWSDRMTPPAVAEVPRECNACRRPATRFADGLLWCEPCHDMTGPGAVNLVPVDGFTHACAYTPTGRDTGHAACGASEGPCSLVDEQVTCPVCLAWEADAADDPDLSPEDGQDATDAAEEAGHEH
jgi:hypothetical protein